MLLCSCLSRPDFVWSNTSEILSEDLLYIPRNDPTLSDINVPLVAKEEAALREIDSLLHSNGKSLQDFSSLPLPVVTSNFDVTNHLMLQELNYDRQALGIEATKLVKSLNSEQKHVFDNVMSSVYSPYGGFFFVYGYGGTGKTFLWNALSSSLRAKGEIVLTVASSGIAATLLPSGRTAHSRLEHL
ncbi:uncharacterized protein LOC129290186 [Prosopis cineraria]|uniref:uncharacterized protein LOC129290186 n=1 Tax=Prosopis cineraria TaxID=364024 RepID=UPI0024106402|nr:uncharacterized protein LOC129290186 [Prosopis cineraria]